MANVIKSTLYDEEIDPTTGLTGQSKGRPVYGVDNRAGAMTREEAYDTNMFVDKPINVPEGGWSIQDEGLEYGEDVAQHRHEEQGFFGSLGSALVQTGTTLAGQTLQGIGYLTDIEQIGNVLTGREAEFNNFLAQAGTDLIEAGADIAPIYQDPSKEGQVNLGDWSYWAANAPSIISTLSMMLPGMAVAGALGKVGAISKMGALAQWGIKGAVGTLTSRYIEASMEAAPLVKQFEGLIGQELNLDQVNEIKKNYGVDIPAIESNKLKSLVGKPLTMSQAQLIKDEYGIEVPFYRDSETGAMGFMLTDELANKAKKVSYKITPELAKEAGGRASARNFTHNMALVATDLPQFLVATMPFGGISKGITKAMAKTLGKEFIPVLAKKGAKTLFQGVTEGGEEGYQYITSEDAKNVELARMGLIEKSELSDRVAKYVTDGEFTTSAIFGALGAGVMMGGMKGINKLKAMKNGGQSEDELRLENAESWAPTLNAYTAALKEAESAGDTKAYERIHNDFMTSLEIKAAANQNSDALIDFIEAGKSGEAKDVEELGFDENTAKHLKENGDKIIEKLKSTGKVFQQNLNETGGNRTQAEILTLADVKVDHYTNAARKSNAEVDKLVNDDNNWVPNGVTIGTPVPTNLKTATKLDNELIHWNNTKVELNKSLEEANSKLKTGEKSFKTEELNRKIVLVDNNINRVSKEREALNYTEAQRKEDYKSFSLKPTVVSEFNNTLKEKVINERELGDNLHNSQFYRTQEGRDTLKKENYKVEKKAVEDAIKSVIEKDKETPQSPLDLINQMREADGTDLSSSVNNTVNSNVSAPKVDVGDSVNLNEIEQQVESDKNAAIKEQERLAKEDRRLNNSVSILNAIDKLKVSKQIVLEDAQSLEDTVTYLHELLYQVGDLSFDNVSSIEKQIKELNKIISSKSSKLTKHGNLTGKRIELLKENIKDEFTLLNDLTNRIQYLKEQISQLEEISKDLDNQMNYYHNLIADKSFETLNKEELADRIKSIKRKQSILERLIANLRKSIEKSIEIISHYVKYTVDSIKRLTKFETETGFKKMSIAEIQDAIRNNDNSIDNYSQLSQEYDKLEAEVSSLISDTELIEEVKDNEAKHIQELQNKLRVYDNQIRYIEELINGDLSLIEKEGIVFNENLDKNTVESVVEQIVPEPVVKRRPGRPKKNPEKVVVPKVKSGKSNKKDNVTNEVVTPEEVTPEAVYPEDLIDNGLFSDESYFNSEREYVESQESINAKKKFETTFNNNYGENALVNLATDMLKFMKANPQFKDEIESNLNSVEEFKEFVMQIIQESIDNNNESANELRIKLAQFYKDKNDKVAQAKANEQPTISQTELPDEITGNSAGTGKTVRYGSRSKNTAIVPTMYTNKAILDQKVLDSFGITDNDKIEIALHSEDSYEDNNPDLRKYVLIVKRGSKTVVIGNLPSSNHYGTAEEKAILKQLRQQLFEYYKDPKNTVGKIAIYKPNGKSFSTKLAGWTGEYSTDIKQVDGVDKVQRHSPNSPKLVKVSASNRKADASNSLLSFIKKVGNFVLGSINESNGVVEWGQSLPNNVGDGVKIGSPAAAKERIDMSNKTITDNGTELVVTYIKPHDIKKATAKANENKVSYEQYALTTYGEERGFNKEEYGADAISYAKDWLNDKYSEESKGSLFVGIPNPAAPWDILVVRAFYTPLSELKEQPRQNLLNAINSALSSSTNVSKLLEQLGNTIYLSKRDRELIATTLNGLSTAQFKEVMALLQKDNITAEELGDYKILKSIINNSRIVANNDLFNKPAGEWTSNLFVKDDGRPYNEAIGDYIYFTIKPETPLTNVSPIINLDFKTDSKEGIIPNAKPVSNAIPPQPAITDIKQSVVSNAELAEKSQEAVVVTITNDIESKKTAIKNRYIKRGDDVEYILDVYDKREEPFRSSTIKRGKIEAISKDGRAYMLGGKWYNFKDGIFKFLVNHTINSELAALEKSEVKPVSQEVAKEESVKSAQVGKTRRVSGMANKILNDINEVDNSADEHKDTDETIATLYQSTETVTVNSKEELAWFKKYFPGISVGQLEEIKEKVAEVTSHGHTAWAAYYNASIWLRDNMPEGTVYHEAFHVIFNLGLSQKERNQLLAQAEGNTLIEKEEWLADKFKSILLTDRPDSSTKGFINKIFRQLKQFLIAIWNNKNGLTLHKLAERVEQGKYTKLRTDRFNDKTLRLYKQVAGWSYAKSKIATDSINKYIVTELLPGIRKENPKMTDMTDAEVMNAVIKEDKDTFSLHRGLQDDFLAVADALQEKIDSNAKKIKKGGLKQDTIDKLISDNEQNELYRSNLIDLASKMFNEDGVALPLAYASLEEFNKNQGIIVKISGADNKAMSIEQYMEAIDDDTNQSEVYDVNFISKSNKNDAPSQVKNVLRYLKTGEKNEFGLPKYYGYDQTYNTLLKQTAGVTSVKELVSILEKNVKNYPQYKQLLDMIKSDKGFGTSMFQAFNRPNMTFHFMYAKDGKVIIGDANKSGVADSLYKAWSYNFNNKKTNFFNGAIHGKTGADALTSYEAMAKPFSEGIATDKEMAAMSKLLYSIGLTITVDNLKYFQNNLGGKLYGLYNSDVKSIKSILAAFADKKNPFEDADSKSVSSLKYLSQLVKSASPEMFETSHIGISGEKEYSQVIPQFMSILIHNMHDPVKVLDILDNYSKDPLFATGRKIRYSTRVIKGKDGKLVKTEIKKSFNVIADLTSVTFNNILLQKTADIFKKNPYESTEIEGAINRNLDKQDIIREQLAELVNVSVMSGKNIHNAKKTYSKYEDIDLKHARMHMFWFNGNKSKSLLVMPPLSDSPNMLTIATERLSKDKAIAAIIRIAEGEYNRIQRLKNAVTENGITNYDDDASLRSTDTGYNIATMFNGFDKSPAANVVEATALINEYYKQQAIDYANKLVKYKLIALDGDKINFAKSKLGKDLLAKMNNKTGILEFVTDMLMNTTVSVSAMSTLSIGDPAFYKYKNGSSVVDYIKRAKEIFSPKSLPDTDASYDVHNTDGSYRETVNVGNTYNSIYVKDVKMVAPSMAGLKVFLQSQVDAKIISQQNMDDLIDQYNVDKDGVGRINQTDAQAFITPQFYRKTMVAHKLWTDSMQRAYDNIMEGKGTGADMIVLQPIKPFMFNQKYNKERGIMVPNQHKNSEFILMPQLVNSNPELKALYDYMNENNVDIVNFDSAVKVGEYGATKFDELVNRTSNPVIHQIDMLHRGIQQATPEHHIGSTGKFSTQLQVNAIANLKHRVDENDPNSELIYYYVGDKRMTAVELQSHYMDLIEANLEQEFSKVREEFLTDGKLDWVKISNILRLAAEGEQLPMDFIEAISYDGKTGKIKLPPFDPLFGTKMESIFHSMFRNRITSQKIQQAALIQVSSVGLSDTLKLVFGNNEDRVKYEQDLVDSENIVTFAKLNEEVLKSLELKGYNEEMWNTLTETEKEHAIKCS